MVLRKIFLIWLSKTKSLHMKKIFFSVFALAVMAAGCKNETADSETPKDTTTVAKTEETPAPALSQEEQNKKWMEYAMPGAVHEMLAKSNGTWIGEGSMWMNPDSPAVKMTGTAVNKMILGGRYQESVHSGVMPGMGGLKGKISMGIDNGRKEFQSKWMDNMGTGTMYMEGTWDEATKTLNSKGKMYDPLTNKELDVRETYTIVDDNTHSMQMFCSKDGKEFKSMEMTLKRKK